jgi:hypothetical protein
MDIRTHATESLDQLASTISKLSQDQFQQRLQTLNQNSIGKQVRHVVEFFECLRIGNLHSAVNYDKRERNLILENSVKFTLLRIQDLQSEISGYEDKSLTLISDYGSGPMMTKTTLFRELVYNIEHCVHHLAIIKISIQAHFPSIELDENLGVAFSTQKYQNQS